MRYRALAPRGCPWPPLALFFSPILALAAALAMAGDVGHVIHVSVDGLRGDLLQTYVNSSPLLYPNFKRFVDEGASTFNARTDFTHTVTIPNHVTILTSRPVSQPSGAPNTTHHGYTSNDTPSPTQTIHNSGNPSLSYAASAFDVAHDNGLSTALYASKTKFVLFDQSYDSTNGALDTTGADNGRDKIDTYLQKSTFVPGSHPTAAQMQADYLTDMATSEYDYTFLHYIDPDSAGHRWGWGSAGWNTSVQDVDGYLGGLFNLVETDPGLLNDTTIIVTSDHGGVGAGHDTASNPANYTIPVLVWGPGVAAGADLYALNPTTRLDPGTGRPDYTAALQPIRNGDTSNLALDLLGLGPIPGSLSNSSQNLSVVVPEPTSVLLLMLAASYSLLGRFPARTLGSGSL
ncbi:MAG: alkaline phosphatase family protein [Pirellulales bacterium]|nr:alkaline phosphatase family protein [Pirellulales bacterium]